MATTDQAAADGAVQAERLAELRDFFRWHECAGIALDIRTGRLWNRQSLRLAFGADAVAEWSRMPGPVVLRGSGAWWRAALNEQRAGRAVEIPRDLRAPEPDPCGWWP
ncbi:MAG: hypothetical protein RL722_531 [Pseudomonadota bacterium]|jgi:hypothetical protein